MSSNYSPRRLASTITHMFLILTLLGTLTQLRIGAEYCSNKHQFKARGFVFALSNFTKKMSLVYMRIEEPLCA